MNDRLGFHGDYGDDQTGSSSFISPLDIKPDDCTLAHLASVQLHGEGASESIRRLIGVEVREGSTLKGFGCIACKAQIRLEGGIEGELKGVGLCSASFSAKVREIVAPKTADRARRIVDEALRKSN